MHRIACTRYGALVGVIMALLIGGLVAADFYPSDLGPQLATDRNVVVRGQPVTVYLNTFPAGQHVVLSMRPALNANQNPIIASFPVNIDANGGGVVAIATTGLAIGTYIVVAIPDGSTDPPPQGLAAFAVVDAGQLGPRAVRAIPLPLEDKG